MPKKKIPIVKYGTPSGKKLLATIDSVRQTRDYSVTEVVSGILSSVKTQGDKALFEFIEKFDKVKLSPKSIKVTDKELKTAAQKAPAELKEVIRETADRIRVYHTQQVHSGFSIKTNEGTLSQIITPLNRVALYIPGGKAVYSSTVLMNAIPAQIAGVKEIVAVTPPRGELDSGIAFALTLLGITEIYKMGGAQAVGALAYGTKTIKRVDKIVGPGNSFVATAKRLVYGTVDIDSIAGPSEVVIIADKSVKPSWVAYDLLAQAEHGSGDELAICITEDEEFAQEIVKATLEEIDISPCKERFLALPTSAISVIVCGSRDESIAVSNEIGPEHLQIMTKTCRSDVKKITNAAAVFLGKYTPVALGDYFIGTNHVLPTGGGARFASPLGVDSFTKRISVADITAEGLDYASPFVSTFARHENFIHHALSVEKRG
ncbi:MAG: histidinol dehydrogenase [Fibrobacter sp.]|nr:histidinol dehydrogenase [Fibrobacter sp.]